MKKSLLVASVLALFASMSFAQAQTAPMGEPAATASAPAKHKKHHKAAHKSKKHHKAASAASGASQ
ncbi:hypothetical protein JY96_17655 [Aquabacterium sp. NJ1]|uniref:hypothetical protein n=1 Tax=Aquabacterium sp. NJ1 TaxID=1538295 RepID=UPI00052DD779|nr:hypothetical protein [Aquabacterium sp. NJ1]KGM41270.1 hypothetical protein JY96_17655 [Aquabacterium sp. NJ1]